MFQRPSCVPKTRSTGWAYSVVSAGGMPPPAGAGRWQVRDGSKCVEQTIQIRQGVGEDLNKG